MTRPMHELEHNIPTHEYFKTCCVCAKMYHSEKKYNKHIKSKKHRARAFDELVARLRLAPRYKLHHDGGMEESFDGLYTENVAEILKEFVE